MPPKKRKATEEITPLSEDEFNHLASIALPKYDELPVKALREYEKMKKKIPNLVERFKAYIANVRDDDPEWNTLLPVALSRLKSFDDFKPLAHGHHLTFPPNVFDDPFPAHPLEAMRLRAEPDIRMAMRERELERTDPDIDLSIFDPDVRL